MGKLTISMAIFNSYVKLPEGTNSYPAWCRISQSIMGDLLQPGPGNLFVSPLPACSACRPRRGYFQPLVEGIKNCFSRAGSSGKRLHSHGKSWFLSGQSTINGHFLWLCWITRGYIYYHLIGIICNILLSIIIYYDQL